MDKVRVRAVQGGKVLHPVSGRPITHDEKGELVPHTTHVARRILEGSLVVVAEKPAPAPAAVEKTDSTAKGAK